MTGRPSLGIFGPYGSDKSGVARYIEESVRYLGEHYSVTVTSNSSSWTDPRDYDAVLYHLGNNRMHHTAFKAARLRRGVALVHEYLHLDYYYQASDVVPPVVVADLVDRLTTVTGIQANTLPEFRQRCGELGTADPYAIDVGVEEYVVANSAVTAVHSPDVAGMLASRYPKATVAVVPFPVRPFPVDLGRDPLRRYGIPDDSFVFATFGFIGEYKRVEWILEAWRRWRDRPYDSRLVLVGERQVQVDAELDGVVELGYVGDSEFERLLASVDCGIQLRHPSLGETSGPAAALVAHQRPLIVSDIPQMRLGCNARRTLWIASGDEVVDSLVAAMRLQHALGREPPTGLDPRFSWQAWTDAILRLLDKSW